MGTFITAMIIFTALGAALYFVIKSKADGKSSCGCGGSCGGGCPGCKNNVKKYPNKGHWSNG